MYDRASAQADRITSGVLRQLDRLYPAAVSPLMKKHEATLSKLEKLENEGAYGRARVLIRKSGLIDDLAKAIASTGVEAAALIRAGISDIREAAANDDAG